MLLRDCLRLQFLNMIQDTQHPTDGDVAPVAPVAVKFKKSPDEQLVKVGSALPRLGAGAMADLSWTAAFPLITSWLYKYYADTAPIVRHWVSLKKYMDGVHDAASKNEGGLPAFWTWGDWCAVESRAIATPATGPELVRFQEKNGLISHEEWLDFLIKNLHYLTKNLHFHVKTGCLQLHPRPGCYGYHGSDLYQTLWILYQK